MTQDPNQPRTARLLLTRPTEQDRAFHSAVHSDPRLYTHAPHVLGTAESNAQFFEAILQHWAAHGFGYWVARDRESGMPWGWVGVQRRDEHLNLYYRFVPEAQGRGLAREAARAAVAMATEWHHDRVVRALVKDHNAASVRTARAAGLVPTGEQLVLADDLPQEPPSSVFAAPSLVRVEALDDATRRDLVDLWCRVNDAGGAVGFLPGAPVGLCWPRWARTSGRWLQATRSAGPSACLTAPSSAGPGGPAPPTPCSTTGDGSTG